MKLGFAPILVTLACGSATATDLRSTGTDHSVEGADPLKVTKNDDIVLSPFAETNEALLVATLTWDQDNGRCEIDAGHVSENAVARFVEVFGEVNVFGVVPWALSFPEGVDPLDKLEPSVKHKFLLHNEDLRLMVVFSYVGSVITLHDVTQK